MVKQYASLLSLWSTEREGTKRVFAHEVNSLKQYLHFEEGFARFSRGAVDPIKILKLCEIDWLIQHVEK